MKETKTILKGGRIYDGTASEPFVGDILFQGDRILEVASSIDDPDAEVIDISGLSVSSGFFDAHSHNDGLGISDTRFAISLSHLRSPSLLENLTGVADFREIVSC